MGAYRSMLLAALTPAVPDRLADARIRLSRPWVGHDDLMIKSGDELLGAIERELAQGEGENRLVALLDSGQAPREVLAALAAEERLIIPSDWRGFLTLAARSAGLPARRFFTALADGEGVALARLDAFAAASGLDQLGPDQRNVDQPESDQPEPDRGHPPLYQPLPGCQVYPAFVAWLALNADPIDAVLALSVNFAAWRSYCAAIAVALRREYGFDDSSCAFFDFFAEPAPSVREQALAAVQQGLDAGWSPDRARRHARLLRSYELMFWNTLADLAGDPG